ncbi:NADP-dependent oxidoreductase [Streptomyces sp. NPDC052396]|uniref:NADP-dependent oxidoreductase n=1 Tax=Streptomyces sp. NPDC052396 TaxID=3365689 RepID=UPI0037D4384D
MTISMRAVSQRAYGGPEVLEVVRLDRPVPRPGEVLVKVLAAGVNPADWKLRSGLVRKFGAPPFVLGLDFCGVVTEPGDDSGPFRPGDVVYGCGFPPRGTYAEYTIAPVTALAAKPSGLDAAHAAALPVAGLTAWQSLVEAAAIRAGQRVLIHAAAGGVGHLAVQIAKSRGAYVIGTARAEKHSFLRELGADELLDYTATDFAAVLRDIDVVLDPISGDYGPRSLRTLAPGGILVDVRGTGPDRTAVRADAERRGLRFAEFGFTPSGADLRRLGELADQGGLRVLVDRTLPLDEAAEAHRLSESNRLKGKLVLVP